MKIGLCITMIALAILGIDFKILLEKGPTQSLGFAWQFGLAMLSVAVGLLIANRNIGRRPS